MNINGKLILTSRPIDYTKIYHMCSKMVDLVVRISEI